MISDSSSYIMMLNGTLSAASASIPQNTTVIVNGGGVSLPSTIPPNSIVINGNSSEGHNMTLNTNTCTVATTPSTTTDVDRPFACEVCGVRYKSKPGLTYHRQHQHGSLNLKVTQQMPPAAITLNAAYNGLLSTNVPSGSAQDVATAAAVAALAASAATSSGTQPVMQMATMVGGMPNQQLSVPTPDSRPYVCTACGVRYKSKPGLTYHRLHAHFESSKNQSMVTDMSYTQLLRTQPGLAAASVAKNALALAATAANSSADAERPHACEFCGARYKSKPGLAYHRMRTHQEEKAQSSFTCETCNASYKSKPGLTYHKLHAHPELYPSKHT